jgi:hypothetical protein
VTLIESNHNAWATYKEPTTRRAVAFSPDHYHVHVKQPVQNDLCRASLGT